MHVRGGDGGTEAERLGGVGVGRGGGVVGAVDLSMSEIKHVQTECSNDE